MNQNTSLTIYKTTILPLLEYSNVIFPLIPMAKRRKLQRLQNRGLKIIFHRNLHRDLEDLHIGARLTSGEQRASWQLTCLCIGVWKMEMTIPLCRMMCIIRSNNKIRFLLQKPNFEKFKTFPLYILALASGMPLMQKHKNANTITHLKTDSRPPPPPPILRFTQSDENHLLHWPSPSPSSSPTQW